MRGRDEQEIAPLMLRVDKEQPIVDIALVELRPTGLVAQVYSGLGLAKQWVEHRCDPPYGRKEVA